jgi:hypothetical protein
MEHLPPSTPHYFIKDDVTLPVCVCVCVCSVYTAMQPQVQTNHKTWSLYYMCHLSVTPTCHNPVSIDNLRGQKSLGPLKMSLEMAHKVIVPPKKNYIPQFLKQRDINSYYGGGIIPYFGKCK